MEDVHRIRQNLLGAVDDSYSYFGVYDGMLYIVNIFDNSLLIPICLGHGGRHIVNYLEEQLEKNVATELLLGDDATVQERLTRAFLITDMQSRQQQNNTAGATAVSVLLRREQGIEGASDLRRIYAANVGDSRAVLLTKNPEPGK